MRGPWSIGGGAMRGCFLFFAWKGRCQMEDKNEKNVLLWEQVRVSIGLCGGRSSADAGREVRESRIDH